MTNSQQPIAALLSWRRFCRRSAGNLSSIKNRVRPQMRWLRREQLLFAIDQVRGIEGRQLEPVAMGNRIRRAGFHAISAKNAAVVINVIDLGVAFRATDPLFGRVFCRLDVNAVGRAIRRTKKTRHALFQTILIALQYVDAAIPLLEFGAAQRSRSIGIVLDRSRLKHLLKSDAHAFGDGGDILDDRHTTFSISNER